MSLIQSVANGFYELFSEFGAAHQEIGSSIAARIGNVSSNALSGNAQVSRARASSPIVAAMCLQMISRRSIRDNEFEEHIDRMIEQGNYRWLETTRLHIGLNSIVKDPDSVLDKVAEYIKANPDAPLDVKFFDDSGKTMAGIDAGGLSRQLIGDLFQEIPKSKVIKFETLKSNLLLPVSNGEELSKSENAQWTQIGIVLDYCLRRGNLLIGAVFEECFYEALIRFDSSKTDYCTDFDALLSIYETLKKEDEDEIGMIRRFKNLLSKETLSKEEQEEAFFIIYPDELEPRKVSNPKAKLREKLIEMLTPKMKQYLEPLRCIAQACKGLESYTAPLLLKKLQGRVDKDFVQSQMKFSVDHPNESSFKRWVSESTDDELKALIKAATGASTIGSTPITIVKSEGSMTCFHTCASQIDLPVKEYSEYIAFKAMLSLSIEYGLAGGFQSM